MSGINFLSDIKFVDASRFPCPQLGSWDLHDWGIKVAHISKYHIKDLKVSSIASQGILKKFNVHTAKTVVRPVIYKTAIKTTAVTHTRRLVGVDLMYVKAGAYRNGIYSTLEPLTEAICADIGKALGFDVLPVELWLVNSSLFDKIEEVDPNSANLSHITPSPAKFVPDELVGKTFSQTLKACDMVLVSVTKSFHRSDSTYNSCSNLVQSDILTDYELYARLVEIAPATRKKLDQMLVFDFIVQNPDRHGSNFGYYVNHETGSYDFTPLIDHGQSLFTLNLFEDLEDGDILNHAKGHYTRFSNLMTSLSYIDWKNVKDLNLELTGDDLVQIIAKYERLLPKLRYQRMCELVKGRWDYVRKKILS